ncbi:MAG: hypothetical protein DRH90_19450 [Deltaproteobacteria bacterium]|nr:MAG: hypothetical protein DRH90_19450 [Deltaproteobacteria bacterium]
MWLASDFWLIKKTLFTTEAMRAQRRNFISIGRPVFAKASPRQVPIDIKPHATLWQKKYHCCLSYNLTRHIYFIFLSGYNKELQYK